MENETFGFIKTQDNIFYSLLVLLTIGSIIDLIKNEVYN